MTDRRAAITVAAGLSALALAMGIGRFGYTALLPAMQAEGLSDADAGIVAAANLFGYVFGSWAAGRTPPAWWRPGLLACVALSVLSTAAMATGGFGPWLLWRALAGPASAGVFVLGVGLMLERLAALGRGDWGGFAFSGVGFGIAASGAVAFALTDAAAAWLALGALALGFALPAALLARPGAAHAAAPPAAPAAASPALRRLTAAYVLEGFGYSVAATFLVAVVARGGGLDLAAWAWVVAGLAAAPAFVVWRRVARRAGLWRALGLAYAIQAAAIALPALSAAPVAALAAAIGFGGTFLAITALTVAEARHLGGVPAIGRVTVLYGIGQALGPMLAGWLAEARGGFDSALVASGACVAAGAVILLSPKLRRSDSCPS